MAKTPRTLRSYLLKIEANPGKTEEARYACFWYRAEVLRYARHFYESLDLTWVPTTGKGQLAHDAQNRAQDIIKAGFAAYQATGDPFQCPTDFPLLCAARFQEATGTTYAYWIKPPTCGYLPAHSHRALKNALRRGGKLRPTCEVRQGKKGGLVARVFVEFPRKKPVLSADVLACDVGVNIGVAHSDGYKSRSLRPLLTQARTRNAARQKQGHHKKSTKTTVKQFLDREARKAVTLAAYTGKTLVLESPQTLGNLKPSGSIGGWPRQHYDARCRQIAEEFGVFVFSQRPARSSLTCPECGHCEKANRQGQRFCCLRCSFIGHADTVAAINLARWARGQIRAYLAKAARNKSDVVHSFATLPVGGAEKS